MEAHRLNATWRRLLLRGVLAVALGLIALFWPGGSISLLIRIVGLFLLADALTLFLSARHSVLQTGGSLQLAVSLVAGAALLLFPEALARLAFILLGIWALLTGIAFLLDSRPQSEWGQERSAPIALGLASLVAGLALIFWPGSGVVALAWAIALVALALGAILIAVALRLRGLEKRLAERL